MKAKLAVTVAAAIVFAPGWGDLVEEARGVPHLGARILAPTLDEAAERTTFGATKRHERLKLRTKAPAGAAWVPKGAASGPQWQFLFAALALVVLLAGLRGSSPPPQRGPPSHLLTV